MHICTDIDKIAGAVVRKLLRETSGERSDTHSIDASGSGDASWSRDASGSNNTNGSSVSRQGVSYMQVNFTQ